MTDAITSGDGTADDDTTIVTAMIEGRPRRVQLSRRALLAAMSGSLIPPLAGVVATGSENTVRVDPALIEHFAVLRSVLVESDNRVGAAAILPTARQQLGHITGFRRVARGGLHDALLRTEARWAEFAGWLSDDLGDRAAGDWWLAQALTMAQEAGDAEFTAYVFARMAQRAAEATDRDRVLGLARAADRSGAAGPPVRAFAALQRAHGQAIAGDTSAFQAAVNDAHHLVANTPQTTAALAPSAPSRTCGRRKATGGAVWADRAPLSHVSIAHSTRGRSPTDANAACTWHEPQPRTSRLANPSTRHHRPCRPRTGPPHTVGANPARGRRRQQPAHDDVPHRAGRGRPARCAGTSPKMK
ncbi:hypothetical protein [Micromonospora echinaurantiaca]|uniref:hypothetical protein n=1 Tax=Micromonospora echinaurantiaca TaxID=47857 RepID=UPI0034292ED2